MEPGPSGWAGEVQVSASLRHAPTLGEVGAFVNPAAGTIALAVTGADVDDDVVGFDVQLLDADGLPLVGRGA